MKRGTIGPISLDNPLAYYAVRAPRFALGPALRRATVRWRSPFGHVALATGENQLRATFQGYPVERYKLVVFVLSATITGAGPRAARVPHSTWFRLRGCSGPAFRRNLLAMVVIGGMRNLLGPAFGALFFILFRELYSIWTADWLLWFGLIFVGFVVFSPSGLVGIWAQLQRRWRPVQEEVAAMSKRRILTTVWICRDFPAAARNAGKGAERRDDIETFRWHPCRHRRKLDGECRKKSTL